LLFAGKICLFQLNNNACWDGTHFHGKCPINHCITICSQLVKKTKPSFGGKFGQNYKQTLLLFSSQPPPLFALS